MNEEMKVTWLEISEMLGEPTPEELSVFLRAWQRAIQAEREECAKVCDAVAQQMDDEGEGPTGNIGWVSGCADAIRARGQA
jgi:hypothetical protein